MHEENECILRRRGIAIYDRMVEECFSDMETFEWDLNTASEPAMRKTYFV